MAPEQVAFHAAYDAVAHVLKSPEYAADRDYANMSKFFVAATAYVLSAGDAREMDSRARAIFGHGLAYQEMVLAYSSGLRNS